MATRSRRTPTSNTERIRVRSITKVTAAKRDVVAGQDTEIRGRVLPAGQRDVVVKIGGQTKRAHADKKGRFQVEWKAPGAGKYPVRAQAKSNNVRERLEGLGRLDHRVPLAQKRPGTDLASTATARLAGRHSRPRSQGVAHKSLPCGTKLSIRHGSREVHVQVIDRGPYVGNREFDLTSATKDDLGFSGTGRILVSK